MTQNEYNEKLSFIIDIVKDLGCVKLSSMCGKYHELVDNDVEIIAISFAGKYGYNQTLIEKLSPKTIEAIYNDLYKDFGD